MSIFKNITFLIVFVASTSFAKSKEFRNTMHDLVKHLESTNVFSPEAEQKSSDDDFKKKAADFNLNVQKLKAEDFPTSEGFSISLKALQRHAAEADRLARLGQIQYAKWMLGATTSVCITCHTQTPSRPSLTFEEIKKKTKTTPELFARAEYFFVTRQFDKASEIYTDLIQNFPANGLMINQLDRSLRRQLVYFARVKLAPKEGMENFELYRKNEKIPEAVNQNIQAWAAQFRAWTKEKNPTVGDGKAIVKFANQKFKKGLWERMVPASDPKVVDYLRVSGLAYAHLYSNKESTETPELLLILGRCENSLNDGFLYSLGDLYFRECLDKYSQKPVAKDCYFELEKSVKKSYLTTTGLEIPTEVANELAAYRKILNIAN